jgi:hypothetical protein
MFNKIDREKKWSLWDKIVYRWYAIGRGYKWLKCYLFHPYNVIKVRSLPPTWCDKDHLILEVNFQLLVDYVEKERAFEIVATDDPSCKEQYDEVKFLYKWWTEDRKNRIEPFDETRKYEPDKVWDEIKQPNGNTLLKPIRSKGSDIYDDSISRAGWLDELYHEEDTEMLVRLMKIRRTLWV